MPKNIFVLGLDAGNRRRLEDLPGSADYRFHPLLSTDELLSGDIDLSDLLDKARDELDAFDGAIDAIVGYWDFPVRSMLPILCQERSLPTAPLEAVLKCEHKYWSRLEQQSSTDKYPAFTTVGLRDRDPPEEISYPMWIKPVKAFSSELDTARISLPTSWTMGFDRGDWNAHRITRTVLSCSPQNFLLHAELDAYEGNERVFSKNWQRTIPRDCV